jgi:hypothetical protein
LELLRYIQTGDFARFASVGGIATIRSYTGQVHGDVHAQFVRAFPPQHAEFIAQLETYYEQPGLFVSHAGYDPNSPTSRAVDVLTSRSHPELFEGGAQPDVLTVCGHYAQRGRVPFADDRFV